VRNALKRCGSFKGPSSSQCLRIKEGISAKLPRSSACTGIRYAERSEIWKLTSGRHEQRGGVDHHDRTFQRRRCGDGQPKGLRFSVNCRLVGVSAHVAEKLISSTLRWDASMSLQSAGTAISAMANPLACNVLGSSRLASKPFVTPL